MIKIYKYGEVPNSEIFARDNISSNVEGIVTDIIANVRANLRGNLNSITIQYEDGSQEKLSEKYGNK